MDQAVRAGLSFLSSSQKSDGSFLSFSSPTLQNFKSQKEYTTTFSPSIILNALCNVPGTESIRQKLAKWLLKQKSPSWSFNYWARNSSEFSSMPYPDDLDDTFCALAALKNHDAAIIDETCLAKVVKLLIATESKTGGPYRTWLTPKTAGKPWQDIDLAVNANIAYFLKLVGSTLPNLTKLMDQAIAGRRLTSPYYPSAYPIIYYISRAYEGKNTKKLRDYADLQKVQNTLELALYLSSFGESPHASLKQLLAAQKSDGFWSAEAFCMDPSDRGSKFYSGSAALTTALALEAISKTKTRPIVVTANHRDKKNTLHNSIIEQAKQELSHLDPTLKNTTIRAIDDIASEDITLLAEYFNKSLISPVKNDQLIAELSLANLYGWVAYDIFDDFLDKEGRPELLPSAILALRYSLRHFKLALPKNPSFNKQVDRIFDTIDAANSWEVQNARFASTKSKIKLPNYGAAEQLAERALGHALPVLGVLAAQGAESKSINCIEQAIRHYLIARQLNDDLHDWESDLKAGRATLVVTEILKKTQDPAKTKKEFWHHVLPTICKTITSHTAAARKEAAASKVLRPINVITKLADEVDSVVDSTLKEHAAAENFLAAYRIK